ncbi:hypothetical protein MMC28_001680 [Mycoblastus sanguinarius]|nr:hypothetical protein [Mycoblastus sanguinarius]
MASLKLTYTATEEVHAHAHVRFLKAVKTLDEMASRPRGWGCMIVDEGVAMAVVQREYEGAMGELEGRRRELELCEREREGLRGDIKYLTKMVKERHDGTLPGEDGEGRRGRSGVENHHGYDLGDQMKEDGGVGLAM